MQLRGLIDRGRGYIDATAKNIENRQLIANEWFDDVLIYLRAEYGKTKFYSAIEERLLRIWGYDSLSNQTSLDDNSDLPLIEEMEIRVKDYRYRMQLVMCELEYICTE